MNGQNVIAFLYTGVLPTKKVLETIVDTLVANGVTSHELITCIAKDEKGILSSILKDVFTEIEDKKNVDKLVESALTYIGQTYETILQGKNNLQDSKQALLFHLAKDCNLDERLWTAIEIIAKHYRAKYKKQAIKQSITEEHIDTINLVYKMNS